MPPKSKQKKAKSKKKKRCVAKKTTRFKLLKRYLLLFFLFGLLVFSAYIYYLNFQIQSQFSASRWSLPAKVYADNLILHTGLKLSAAELGRELKFAAYRKDKLASTQGSYSLHGSANNKYLLISIRSFYLASGLYQKNQLVKVGFKANQISYIKQAKSNRLLKSIILDPALIAHFGVNSSEDRRVLNHKQVPDLLVKAIMATEDQHFNYHFGVDPIAILRALYANFRAGKTVQGGSTITQQLVKNYFLSSTKSLSRKINEALMAIILEYHYSKQEIMTAYINQVFLGQDRQRAIHGFALASEYFFRRPIQQLSLPQIATLVGLVKGASFYNPRKHAQRALKRRNLVLKLMLNEAYISQQKYNLATKSALGISNIVSHSQSRFPAFTQLLKKQLLAFFTSSQLQQNGLQIYSSLKPWVQRKAEKQLKSALLSLQKKQGKRVLLQSAMVIADTKNAAIIALIGDKQANKSNFNRAINSKRNIGSLVKPAIYLSAFKSGYSPRSLISDEPIKVKLADKSFWYPKNFDHQSHGKVSLSKALSSSYNIAAVRLGLTIGLGKVLDTLQLLGINQQLPIYPSVLLGALSLSPFEVNQIYLTLANKGVYQSQSTIKGVLDKNNKRLWDKSDERFLRFSAEKINQLDGILQQVVQQGTAKSISRYLKKSARVIVASLAAKTGTTNNNRDSWFVAYNKQYVATVWLGNDKNKSIKYTGSTGAMIIWAKVMDELFYSNLKI
ncbi:MAG: transglycosylase domain-containing protein [Pseudomonadota bacterium]